jgi:hypothetical protein
MRAGDAGTGILAGLPDAECGAGGILNDSHATGIEHVEWLRQDGPAEFRGAGGGDVGIIINGYD